MVLKYRIIQICDNSGIFGCIHKLFIVAAEFIAQIQPLFFFGKPLKCLIISKLLSSGLDGKIGLSGSDNRLGRIAVLNNQITGIARKVKIFNRTLSTTTDSNHLVDFNKMVRNYVS